MGMDPKSTPRKRERLLENSDRKATAGRFIRALGRHIADGDPDDLALLDQLKEDMAEAVRVAVLGLRAQGYSWDDIARGYGCSRQYLWRTYGQPYGDRDHGNVARPDLVRSVPISAELLADLPDPL